MATHRASGICTVEKLRAGPSLGVLLGFLGRELFPQSFPRPFFHVFHLFQNVCKKRRETEMGPEEDKQESRGMKPS